MYAVLLFLHVVGAVATFSGIGALFFVALAMRRARRSEEVMNLAWIYEMGAALGLTGILMVAVTGLYLAWTVWGLSRGWVLVAIVAFALLSPIGPLVVGPRFERILVEARRRGEGPLPPDLAPRLRDPIPKLGLLAVVGDLVGIVFLMTVKPSLAVSIAAVAASIVVALGLGMPAVGRAVAGTVAAYARLERNSPLYRRLIGK